MDAEVLEHALALRAEELTYEEIGAALGLDPSGVHKVVREVLDERLELAEVDRYDLPMETTVGMFWRVPRKAPRPKPGDSRFRGPCGYCEDHDACRWAVARGHAVGCERPLKRELDWRWAKTRRPYQYGQVEAGGRDVGGVL